MTDNIPSIKNKPRFHLPSFVSVVGSVIILAIVAWVLSAYMDGEASVEGTVWKTVFAGSQHVAKFVIIFSAILLGIRWMTGIHERLDRPKGAPDSDG